ncbi:AsmA-like C-terminal region-containing protein [Candidatus Pelagibacter sp. Uisw_099_02]|uniref:hypothetical protein n=1 Tax=Candidatus Pelagibacter sp. Uisw_099_02 TaxID=3230981 RepID=UPI0039EB8C58
MIKKISKIILIVLAILVLAIFFLSIFGLKTDKFNNQITNNVLKINKKINLTIIGDVKYLLNPYNFTIDIKTKNPQISIEKRSFEIKDIQTSVNLKSIIDNQFSINSLKFRTKEIKLNDIIELGRMLQNSPELFVLSTIIRDGLVTADVSFNFNKKGKIKKNYKIEGSVRKANLNILNQIKFQNLNFNFNIDKNIYSLKKINSKINNINITSPLIEIKQKKNSFFVNGQFLNDKKNFDIEELKLIFSNLPYSTDIKKIEFSSKSKFSFNINKKFKFDNLKVESIIDLEKLIFNKKNSNLKTYLPSFIEEIKLEEHNIAINYNKDKFDIKGKGNIVLDNKTDKISYRVIKDKDNISFDSKIDLNNNSLIINFLDYEKKENLKSLILVKGNYKKDDYLNFSLINLKENNNEILIKNLDLNKDFEIINIENFDIDYENNKKILNKFKLKKVNSNFIIKGDSFDASKIINTIMDSDDESPSIFKALNTKINIKIKKTYIDEVNYINNLYGNINFINNKIYDLKLESTFPNEKKINFSIKTNNNSETVTKLFTAYPKPLVKRYDFIKGFEEGNLDFYSIKKKGVSNSVLVIDNFKVKEVPIFAKLLSLASLQGMADLLTGEGLRFTDFEMNFSNKKGLTTIEEMYAIGPAVSILMNGYIESKKLVSLRGTLVPATTINRSIASIPLLGKILIGDKTGEGIFGVSFKIKGRPKDLKTSVNPIKTLTPRFITRTLEKIKKN